MLEIQDLHKRYGDTTAIDGVSFAVRPGETFGFVGANGAGKTTTMRIIMGVLQADSGEVRHSRAVLRTGARVKLGEVVR